MKTYTQEELKKIIENHQHWLNEDCEGWETMRADLSGSDLRYSDLRGSNLRYSDLRGSDLRYSDLRGSDLRGSNLRGSDLRGSRYDERTSFFALQCPEKGAFIGFKKVNGYIVELEIQADAKRSSATTRKCRCEFAKVLSITNKDGSDSGLTVIHNDNYCGCDYVVGEIVRSDSWDDDRWNECSHGIHFFITRDEAVNY